MKGCIQGIIYLPLWWAVWLDHGNFYIHFLNRVRFLRYCQNRQWKSTSPPIGFSVSAALRV